MIVSPDELRKDTVAQITLINRLIDELTKDAFRVNCEPHELRDSSGNLALVPLIHAKATAYNTLVMLQTPAVKPGPRGRHQ